MIVNSSMDLKNDYIQRINNVAKSEISKNKIN